jgi:RNA polymerase sigma-70 factor (ECF subfamily)
VTQEQSSGGVDQGAFLALVADLRPDLHRYCARLTGSVIDGEDVVQDAIAKGLAALGTLQAATPLRAWLFRIAHNQALDLIRRRAVRAAEPMEAADDAVDPEAPDPLETLMRQEAVRLAVSRFVELPATQRSVVVLKDVLDHSVQEIAELLDLTAYAVTAHLARGRARLKAIAARPAPELQPRSPSPAVARYAALFNQRDWDGLRALLADDVRLNQASYTPRFGAADVGRFFTIYAGFEHPVRLEPAWLEGREVLAVFTDPEGTRPDYFMWIEWEAGKIAFIHDYRYVRYVLDGAQLLLERA